MDHDLKGRKTLFLYPAVGIFSISLLVMSLAVIDFQEISAIKSPKDFEAVLGPHQVVLDGIDDTSHWDLVTANGHASFSITRDMSEIHYKIHLDNIENVVAITIENGVLGKNTIDDSSIQLANIGDFQHPQDFQDETIEGVLYDEDICSHPTDGINCSVYGLVYEIINHRAFLQVKTDDDDHLPNTGPGDLSEPGEIRGQIYPMVTRIFETQIDSSYQVLDETNEHQMWNSVDSEGFGRFMINDDMTEISYELNFENLENVVGIHIHNGAHNENSHIHLVDLKPTDITNPENFSPGTISGVIHNEDICPNDNSDSKKCSVIGLMNELQNHEAYIQVHTDSDGDLSTNTGQGDLGSPGEIRGQIYPSPECIDCVVNVEDQILTIFKFETEDMPFLANEATFLVTPNPFSHNIGSEFIDPQKFGVNLMITDNDQLDSDPTLGVIELLGVNEGVYSVIELKGPPGLIRTEETFSTHEIIGNSNSHVQVTNIAIDLENTDGPIFFDAPFFNEDVIQHLQSLNAKINGATIITSPDQIPPSMMTSYSEIFSGNPPSYIEFANIVNSNLSIDEIFVLLGILTYDSPSQTSSTEGMTLMPPLFLAENTDGSDLVLSPLFDEVHPGTDLFLRLDGIDSSDLDGTAIAGVHLPMDQYGTDFGLSVEIIEPTEDMIENANEVLILDIDHVGNIDLGDESVFSEPPTIDFRVPTIEGTLNCPEGVEVYLQDDDTMDLNPVTPAPERNMSLDTVNSCGYTQTLLHFSTYVITTESSGGHSGGSSGGGGSGSSGHDHSSHDHGDGSTGGGDSSRRTDSEIAQETIEAGGRLIGKFETFEFGRQDQSAHLVFGKNDFIELGLSENSHLATLTVLEQASSDFGFNFGNDEYEGIRLIAEIDNSQVPIKYSLDGEINRLIVDEQSKSIMFAFEDVNQDEMIITLPKVLIDAENDNFIVLASASPEQEIDYEVIQSTDNFITLKMEMPQDANTLTIVGTKVIPEFGLIGTLILFISISLFIALFKIKRLSSNILVKY